MLAFPKVSKRAPLWRSSCGESRIVEVKGEAKVKMIARKHRLYDMC